MNLAQYLTYAVVTAIVALLLGVPKWAYFLGLCIGYIYAVKTIFKGEDDE